MLTSKFCHYAISNISCNKQCFLFTLHKANTYYVPVFKLLKLAENTLMSVKCSCVYDFTSDLTGAHSTPCQCWCGIPPTPNFTSNYNILDLPMTSFLPLQENKKFQSNRLFHTYLHGLPLHP
jgi:hypothetical protein